VSRTAAVEAPCLHALAGVVASNAYVLDSGGVVRKGCKLQWCPDCGALRPADDAPWTVPGSASVKREVLLLQRRRARQRRGSEARDAN
jgi:hypothetical protein